MAKVNTSINLDAELKKEAQALFADLGLDLTTAITLFLKQAVLYQGIPFRLLRSRPNAETLAALEEYELMRRPDGGYTRYGSFKEAMEDVLNERKASK